MTFAQVLQYHEKRFVKVQLGLDQQYYEVGNFDQVSRIAQLPPHKFTFLCNSSLETNEFSYQALSYVKYTLLQQEENIKIIAERFGIHLPLKSFEISKAFSNWIVANKERITSLDLSNLQLSAIPAQIRHLVNLTELDLSSNCLRYLPPEICYLSNLTRLDISHNPIQRDIDLSQLSQLRVFKANQIQIGKIPDWIQQLPDLKNLEMKNNFISFYPDWWESWVHSGVKVELIGNQLEEF